MAASRRNRPDSSHSLGVVLEYLVPGSTSELDLLRWPPDAFAVCAYVLKLTGAYVEVLREWPPQGNRRIHPRNAVWAAWIREQGIEWRKAATTTVNLPQGVVDLWAVVIANSTLPVEKVGEDRILTAALLQLVAMADEASGGVGIPQRLQKKDPYHTRALELLAGIGSNSESTLSPRISSTLARVLPKQHTPRGGLTLRSLTHHLALHVGDEVKPFWYTVPQSTSNSSLNLLIAPWPTKIRPKQFRPATGKLHEMPPHFGFVEFECDEDPNQVAKWTRELIQEAMHACDRVDGVIFPEAALSEEQHRLVREVVLKHGAFLIAGVMLGADKRDAPGSNCLMFDAIQGGQRITIDQKKHHRWRLDRSQIEMYGLGGTLDPARDWWEHISVGPREVHFVSLNEQLSLCCLVCEDLARQDPVAELVRSVGPNLVVALLMDAPQLGVRWPARYATVLADDPGSSVLTVTSAGMVDLTRPPKSARPSRSIGLWKDARSEAVELELPIGAAGLLLNLCTEKCEEYTADGRSDSGVSGYPRLGGVHFIKPQRKVGRKTR